VCEPDCDERLLGPLARVVALAFERWVRTVGLERAVATERGVIQAALAVNEASTLEGAFDVLVKTALALLDCDRVSIVVWDERLTRGVMCAVAGVGAGDVGEIVLPGENASYLTVSSGVALTERPSHPSGVQHAREAERLDELPAMVSVPHVGEGVPALSIHASWRSDQPRPVLEQAVASLETLAALTGVAYRAERDRAVAVSDARLRAVLDAVGEGLWVEWLDGTVTVNRAARDHLRIEGREIPPLAAFDFRTIEGRPVPPEEMPSALARATMKPQPYRLRARRLDGVQRIHEGTASPVFDDEGELIALVASFRDATESFNQGLLTEQFLERLFEAMPTAVCVIEPTSGEILSVNQAFHELVGYDADESIGGRPPHPWWGSETDAAFEEWLDPASPERVEVTFARKDGTFVPVEALRFALRDPAGEPLAFVGLVTDLSERRRFEQQLVQSGKLAAIGELAAGVAHEINNPLFAILGLVEFLFKEFEPGTKPFERLKLIQQTGFEIKEIVRALLDFSRERSDVFTTVSLQEVGAQTIELIRRTSSAKMVELVERYPEEPLLVEGSPNQLKQVFLNLVTNAQQAMPDGGTVTVEVFREGDEAVARVTDTGPGIPEDVLPRIFEPFFTTKRDLGGSGLGLSVSFGIVEMHGGTLAACLAPEGGTCFELRLPLSTEEDV
jgi:PAS domain S-box-containing protein